VGLRGLPPAVCPEELLAGAGLGALPALCLDSLGQMQSLGTFCDGLLMHTLCDSVRAKHVFFPLAVSADFFGLNSQISDQLRAVMDFCCSHGDILSPSC